MEECALEVSKLFTTEHKRTLTNFPLTMGATITPEDRYDLAVIAMFNKWLVSGQGESHQERPSWGLWARPDGFEGDDVAFHRRVFDELRQWDRRAVESMLKVLRGYSSQKQAQFTELIAILEG